MRVAAALLAVSLLGQEAPKLRLPGDVRPIRYDLDLRIVPEQDDYSGRVDIDIEVRQPVATIWLHRRDLTLTSATVGTKPARVVDGGSEFAGLALEAPLPAGRTRLRIEFTGRLNSRDVEGLFKQIDSGSAYVFTQFEPTSARRAFPCFDEPAYKVPWKITLRVPEAARAFANTPQTGETLENGCKVVRFAETKPLPSYLIALAVGPFDVAEAGAAGRNKVPVRTIAPKGRAAETAYVNEVTPKIVAALEDYFGIPYPYEKLDQISIPITVAFGAMENAGLITYNQTLLLARPEEDTIARQRRAASVITHELGHQWFGNMVTPAWWDDIWLNEAFATWVTGVILERIFPDWKPRVNAVNSTAEVMAQDQLLSARRIRQPIEEHGDIGNAFDGITYQKGAAIIRMFEHYIGRDRMQTGIRNYLRKHAWGNATAADFLAAISATAGQNIAPAFSHYLDRGGVPVLTFELQCEGRPRLAVSQQRSLPLGSRGSRNEYWPVPVCLRYEAGGKVFRQCALVSDPKDEIALSATSSCPEWLNANDQATGYYQVLYKGDLQRKLLAHAAELPLHEKVALLNNAKALVRGGQMPAGDAIALAREFAAAPERELAVAALQVMTSVRRNVPEPLRARYAQLLRDSFGARARALGWTPKPGEDADTRLLRTSLVPEVAITGEDPVLLDQAAKLTRAWLEDRKAIAPELTAKVLSAAARRGGRELYDQLVVAAKKSRNRRERSYIIDALGSFRDPDIARSALNLMLTGELDIRELTGLLADFQNEPATERIPWEFVTAHYDRLLPRLPSRLGTHAGSILPTAGASFCDEAGYRRVEEFFRERIRGVAGGARTLAKTLEAIQLCAPTRSAQSKQLEAYLQGLGN